MQSLEQSNLESVYTYMRTYNPEDLEDYSELNFSEKLSAHVSEHDSDKKDKSSKESQSVEDVVDTPFEEFN